MCKVPHSTSFKSIFALGCKQRATNWVQINFPTKRHPPNVILTLTLIKRPPPAHQGALFRLLALFFFRKRSWGLIYGSTGAAGGQSGTKSRQGRPKMAAKKQLHDNPVQQQAVCPLHYNNCTLYYNNLSAGPQLSDCDPAWQDIDPPGLPRWSQHLACTADGVIHMGLLLAGDNKKHLRSCRCWVESINYTQGGGD